ncbi:MAG: hypothetical protein ACJ8G7_20295, partial [Rhizobacter sp.]
MSHFTSLIHVVWFRLLTVLLRQDAAAAGLRAAVLALLSWLSGCAVLADRPPMPTSTAMTTEEAASTRLGRIAARSLASASEDQSGFRLLPSGSQGIEARVALARRAQRSIDAEYYLLASDSTGLELLRELAAAAQRGVHVRLLVDDLHAAGQDRLFADLASRDRVEVRVFNPLPARNGGFKTRIAWSLHE